MQIASNTQCTIFAIQPDLSCIPSPQNWGPDKQGAVKIADKSSFNYVPI